MNETTKHPRKKITKHHVKIRSYLCRESLLRIFGCHIKTIRLESKHFRQITGSLLVFLQFLFQMGCLQIKTFSFSQRKGVQILGRENLTLKINFQFSMHI